MSPDTAASLCAACLVLTSQLQLAVSESHRSFAHQSLMEIQLRKIWISLLPPPFISCLACLHSVFLTSAYGRCAMRTCARARAHTHTRTRTHSLTHSLTHTLSVSSPAVLAVTFTYGSLEEELQKEKDERAKESQDRDEQLRKLHEILSQTSQRDAEQAQQVEAKSSQAAALQKELRSLQRLHLKQQQVLQSQLLAAKINTQELLRDCAVCENEMASLLQEQETFQARVRARVLLSMPPCHVSTSSR